MQNSVEQVRKLLTLKSPAVASIYSPAPSSLIRSDLDAQKYFPPLNMTTKLLVIVGITGTQGSSVYNVFKHEPGWRIRGLTRDPTKPTCKTLFDAGVELVKADLGDPASVERAFEGANAIYSVTDYFQHLFNDPSTFKQAEKEGKKPTVIAMEREMVHGKNIIHAAAKVSKP